MKLYAKLKFENAYNDDNLKMIEDAAAKAIDYAVGYAEHAVSNTHLSDDGFIRITLVPGQDADEQEVAETMQEYFDEKFSELVKEEGITL